MFIYKGSCHCGLVRFEVRKGKPIDTLIECNCSICTKKGILHTQVEDDEMVILSGEDGQALYQFGTKVARYTFCPRCGCSAFHRTRGRPRGYSVNARCLDDLDELLANKQGLVRQRPGPSVGQEQRSVRVPAHALPGTRWRAAEGCDRRVTIKRAAEARIDRSVCRPIAGPRGQLVHHRLDVLDCSTAAARR